MSSPTVLFILERMRDRAPAPVGGARRRHVAEDAARVDENEMCP